MPHAFQFEFIYCSSTDVVVIQCQYKGSLITEDGYCDKEI